jgi:hypothetical protein
MLYRVHLTWAGFKLTTLVVIGIDCIGSYKSNYHVITTTTAPISIGDIHVTTCLYIVPKTRFPWMTDVFEAPWTFIRFMLPWLQVNTDEVL